MSILLVCRHCQSCCWRQSPCSTCAFTFCVRIAVLRTCVFLFFSDQVLIVVANFPLATRLCSAAVPRRLWLQRSIVPEEFEDGIRAANSSVVVVDWDALREVSARRFPGFGKPMGQNVASSTQVSTARIVVSFRGESSPYSVCRRDMRCACCRWFRRSNTCTSSPWAKMEASLTKVRTARSMLPW